MLIDVMPVAAEDAAHTPGREVISIRTPWRRRPDISGQSLGERLALPLDAMLDHANGLRGSNTYDSFAKDITQACEHLRRVLADLDKGGAKNAVAIGDVRQLINEVWEMFATAADDADVALLLRGGDGPPVMARTGHRQLRQVLINLLSNAIKFSVAGGAVEICLDVTDRIRISVSDSGPGIAPDDRERIFTRFERLQSGVEGKGLGLSISRSYAADLGGRLYAGEPRKEGPCRGAVFVVELPVEG